MTVPEGAVREGAREGAEMTPRRGRRFRTLARLLVQDALKARLQGRQIGRQMASPRLSVGWSVLSVQAPAPEDRGAPSASLSKACSTALEMAHAQLDGHQLSAKRKTVGRPSLLAALALPMGSCTGMKRPP
jgi:hypothetical protein